jgi:diguanylate cyclase (GGDEF)-like protein
MPTRFKLSRLAQQALAWVIALAMIALLGWLRHSTEAEYAFAMAAIVPVLLVAWTGGFIQGSIVAVIASTIWTGADIFSGQAFSEPWIPFANGITRLATYCFIAYLTARVRTLLLREAEMATQDPLTGLLNGRMVLAIGEIEARRARRYAHPMTVMFLDLDNFKQLNDTRGNKAGDEVLKAFANALRRTLRSTDVVGRIGGDKFVVVLHEIDADAAAQTGQRVASTVPAAVAGLAPITMSVGIAWFEHPSDDFRTMIDAADALMHEAKRAGKGRIRTQLFAKEIPAIKA